MGRSTAARRKAVVFGRGADVEAVTREIARGTRVVTLFGPAGIGKTTLALLLAERLGGQSGSLGFATVSPIVVLLAEARSAPDVSVAVMRAFDLRLDRHDPMERVVAAAARRGPFVLVLDNCEHVIDTVRPIVEAVLSGAPQTTIIATSRELLRVEGEHAHEVLPLKTPAAGEPVDAAEAAQLFAARAHLVRASFALDATTGPLVAQIVRRLEGIPLAIELAAARTGVLGLEAIVERLSSQGFALLASPLADVERRQRTMHDAIEWSWSLLDDEEKRVLASCAQFRGGFTAEAAEQVCAIAASAETESQAIAQESAPSTTLDVIDRLRAKSLIYARPAEHGGVRLGLYESIRDFVKNAAPASAQAQARYIEHVVGRAEALAKQTRGAGAREAFEELERERANYVAAYRRALLLSTSRGGGRHGVTSALRLARALEPLLHMIGPRIEPLDASIDAAKDLEDDAEVAELLGEVHVVRAHGRQLLGRIDDAMADCDRALALAKRVRRPAMLEGKALSRRGAIQLDHGTLLEAEADLQRACTLLAGESGSGGESGATNHSVLGDSLARLGVVARMRGDIKPARRNLESAIRLRRQCKDRYGEALDLANVAAVELQAGDLSRARAHFERAGMMFAEFRDRRRESNTAANLGLILRELGDMSRARAQLERAMAICASIGDVRLEYQSLAALGTIAHQEGKLDEAERAYDSALAGLRLVNDRYFEGIFSAVWGGLRADRDEIDAAMALFERAHVLLGPIRSDALDLAVRVHEAHVDLARARQASRSDEEQEDKQQRVAELIERARRVFDEARSTRDSQDDTRFALLLLGRALERERALNGSARSAASVGGRRTKRGGGGRSSSPTLFVGDGGVWFRLDRGRDVDLRRRRATRLVFRALVEQRVSRPGAALPIEDLVARGWPGETMLVSSATSRLYVVVLALRNLGLRKVLLGQDGGYLLDPRVEIALRDP